MTDISALFDDALFQVDLTNPVTGDPVGVTMWIAPLMADTASDAWERTSIQMAMVKNKASAGTMVPVDDVADIESKVAVKRCIAAVRKWEWNGKSFGEIGIDPECTDVNKEFVFSGPRNRWIVDQVLRAGAQLENFTRKPAAT